MVKPNEREKKEVGKITALTQQEVEDLKNILMALGFDYETIALMWNKSAKEVEQAFLRRGLSGQDLLFFCEHVRLRPGVVQRKLNFDRDESRLRTQKVGFKSTRAPAKWIGPPSFCLVGNASDGRAFREVYLSPGVSASESLDQKVLQQIANGNWPVRLPLLASVIHAANRIQLNHRKLPQLEAILASFPEEIQTVEDVFAPAEAKPIRPEEGQVMNKADMTFATSFAAAGLSSKLAQLIESQSLTGWVYEELDWDDDVLNSFADGEKGPLPEQLTQFLAHCKLVGIMGSEALKETQSFYDDNCEGSVTTGQSDSVKGYFGEFWFAEYVTFGELAIPRVGSDDGSLSKRIYVTLKAIRDEFELQWGEVEQKLGLSHENIIALQSGKQVLKPKFLEVLPKALKKHFGVDLTIQEILGIETLPNLISTVEEVETVVAGEVAQVNPVGPAAVATGDMVVIARNIERLIKAKNLKTFDVLDAAGIRYRPHNARVMKGIEGYFYTEQQLFDIAAKLGVSVEEFRGEFARPGPSGVVSETQATVSDAPQEVAQSSSDYDATDKVLRKVVVAQLRKLRDFLGLTGKGFTEGVPSASKDIYYGLVRVESYVLRGLVQKHKSAAPWLSFEWFLSDVDVIVDQVQEPEAEVAPPTSPLPEPEPVVESVSPEPEVESKEVLVVQTEEASVPAEEPKPTVETQEPFLQTFAKAYGPKPEQPLDWQKLFFVFAKAGYMKGEMVASLLEPVIVYGNLQVNWKQQVLAVAGPVLQSVNQAPRLEYITQDASLMKVLSQLSALDVLLLGREIDQKSSRTDVGQVA